MAYTVLARKYRPQSFGDLVGQEHVTRTLSNAILSERVAHAFLFTGVRGVGKTTTARILAKALNCEKGPTPEPCGECDSCVGITAGRAPDVLEMDGASNNSVDDVRRLQESLPYRPQSARFKLVIVDEVHMLSTGAFNAFLKTLEEPPDHVKFIFATTEAHKVPVTIRSRCQRYDFRLIPQKVVTDRVVEILAAESVTADEDTVAIVAREAAGSMRDALTLLDQILAFGGQNLVGTEVAQVLGIADRELVHGIAEAVLSGDGGRVLTLVDELAARGLDMLHFSRQLLELTRDMVVLRIGGENTDLVSMVPEERARAVAAGSSVDVQELHRAFSALSRVIEDVAQSGAPRTTLEMGLVRLATRPPLLPLAEIVARLDAMERRGGGRGGSTSKGGAPRSGGSSSGPGGAKAATAKAAPAAPAPVREPEAPPATASAAPAKTPTAPEATPRTKAAPEAQTAQAQENARPEQRSPAPERPDHEEARPSNGPPQTQKPQQTQPQQAQPQQAQPQQAQPQQARPQQAQPQQAQPQQTQPQQAQPQQTQPQQAQPQQTQPPGSEPPTAADLVREAHPAPAREAPARPVLRTMPSRPWETLVSWVMERKPAVGAVLKHGSPIKLGPEHIELAFPSGSFFGRQAESPESLRLIADAAEALFGARASIEIVTQAEGSEVKTIVESENEERVARRNQAEERARTHPIVQEAAKLFSLPREAMKVHVELE